jgi:hypothetical protein
MRTSKRIVKTLIALGGCLIFTGLVQSASETSQGTTPNGKPFQEIFAAITSLDDRLSLLTQRVLASEQWIESAQFEIELLNEDIAATRRRVEALEDGSLSTADLILELSEENDLLQAELDSVNQDTEYLRIRIQNNVDLISLLTTNIETGLSGLYYRLDEYDYLLGELVEIQRGLVEQMALKQDVLNGSCADGFVIGGFDDGALECSIPYADLGPIEVMTIARTIAFAKNLTYGGLRYVVDGVVTKYPYLSPISVDCPTDAYVIGGGITSIPNYFATVGNSGIYGLKHPGVHSYFDTVSPNAWYAEIREGHPGSNNPMWAPYEAYSGRAPKDVLYISFYALCAKAKTPQTDE